MKKQTKLILGGSVIVTVVLLIGILFIINSKNVNSSPKNVAKGIMQAEANNDVDAFLKCISKEQLSESMAKENESETELRKGLAQEIKNHSNDIKKTINNVTFNEETYSNNATTVDVVAKYKDKSITVPTYKGDDGNWYVDIEFLNKIL